MRLARRVVATCVTAAVVVASRDAAAGDVVRDHIIAATADGAYEAVYVTSDGNLEAGTCGMRKVGDKDLPVKAQCAASDLFEVLPFEKWQWVNPTPAVRRLEQFDRSSIDKIARVAYDADTQTGVGVGELFHGGSWLRARVFEGDMPEITGVIKGSDRYVVRLSYSAPESLQYWDELWVPTFVEVADERGRYERAHKEAREATARMRAHRKQGDTVFAPAPAGTKKEAWEQRRRHGMARLLRKWEIAAALRPLSVVDLKDALWLLAWLDSPRRRYQSLRWYDGVRERDAKAAAAVVDELARDPDTRALAHYLRTTKDYLRGLPYVNAPNDAASFQGLSSEQLLWLHRAVQAHARYHFDDPAVRQYLEGIGRYYPMSERAWKRLTSDPAWRKDPDAHLLGALEKWDPQTKQSFVYIMQAEAQQKAARD